ncbi:MAG: hypothetical protein MZU97_13475 [Bacillus subtilis]|nr:hypothetical protein [Bacillus subtilis]
MPSILSFELRQDESRLPWRRRWWRERCWRRRNVRGELRCRPYAGPPRVNLVVGTGVDPVVMKPLTMPGCSRPRFRAIGARQLVAQVRWQPR